MPKPLKTTVLMGILSLLGFFVSPNQGWAEGAASKPLKITVTANDYKFDPSEIEVQPGQAIELTLKNEGNSDHAITFDLPQGPVSTRENVAPGASQTLTFNAPDKPGEYTYYCPIGLHNLFGMNGKLKVSE